MTNATTIANEWPVSGEDNSLTSPTSHIGVIPYLRGMPKVELHVHLEGSIPPKTLLKLARKYNHPIGGWTEAQLVDWFQFRDFPHFANSYMTICECIRTPEDIELLTYGFLQGQAQQNRMLRIRDDR